MKNSAAKPKKALRFVYTEGTPARHRSQSQLSNYGEVELPEDGSLPECNEPQIFNISRQFIEHPEESADYQSVRVEVCPVNVEIYDPEEARNNLCHPTVSQFRPKQVSPIKQESPQLSDRSSGSFKLRLYPV